ncbi:hypothetical protein NN561_018820 [Cricetulus griseus]
MRCWMGEPLCRQARVPGNPGTGFRGRRGGTPWLLPEGQKTPSSAHAGRALLCGSGHQAVRRSSATRRTGGLWRGRVETPHAEPGRRRGMCQRLTHVPRARRGCPAPTLLGRDAPRSTGPARPVPPPFALPRGQPGGVARGEPAPLMCAGAAVIGRTLMTCGDCGGPGCCGCRSARRG